ncbi:hypothetical protein FJTKL_10256 [Diaporthe vaccinii]|uniref:Vacuolar calcium ion transporter n=1 Tax=Diaporthe vaccinii TaxID=105482 RepID=A0ABR4EKB8_9PEZI
MPGNHDNSRASEYTTLLPTPLRHRVTIAHEGESGRSGFHPRHFFHVLWLSSCTVSKLVNVLWPFVPVAFLLHFLTRAHLWTFAVSYVAMIPAANLLGFAGQEFARKMPKVAGILIETTFGSIVEIILFIVLIAKHDVEEGNGDEGNLIPIIQAAILGSVLTNLLLCLGLCFFFGGIRWTTQKFHPIVSEVGSGLLLVAAFALLIPSAFYSALKSETVPDLLGALHERFTEGKLQEDVLRISQTTSIVLIIAFFLYIWYCASSQHSIFDEVIEMDEHNDADREADEAKPKFTMTETVLALAVSIVVVTLLLVFLVDNIEHVVESGVPDQFLGLILLPLVEKAAEHLTAIDEAWDGVINVALYHCLGPSIQTALFNGPLVVLIGWALGKPMDLNFEIFMIALLVLSILAVGNFLRDGESNWLEGALLVVSSRSC